MQYFYRAFVVVTAVLILSSTAWAIQPTSPQVPGSIPNVSWCNLLKKPKLYSEKIVRIRAIFLRSGEETSEMYCPGCFESHGIYASFADSFQASTKKSLLKPFERQFDVTLAVTLTGKFIALPGGHLTSYRMRFIIFRAERVRSLPFRTGYPTDHPKRTKRLNQTAECRR
jgi:hypothetical protein